MVKRVKSRLIIVFLVAVICVGLVGITKVYKNNDLKWNISTSHEEITWVQNEDGSYTFTNNAGDENSVYAWYVLDETGEAIYKTKYSDSMDFTYDLAGNRNLTIKGFIRTGTEEQYDQTSIKVQASNVLGPAVYSVKSVNLPENGHELLRDEILNSGQATLPVESVMEGDGSAWNVDLNLPVDWRCLDITNRSYGFRTNGLVFLDDTYSEYCSTGDEKYAKLIMTYVIDWAKQNQEYKADDEWVWHDDATALRVFRMSLYYDEFKELCTRKEQKMIEDSLAFQAELLTSDEFYTEKHNHGMHQDIALLTYALLHAEGEQQKEYIAKALSRTGDYLDYVYTDDGIHKEHSPFYAIDVLSDDIFLQKLLRDISPEFVAHINQYIVGAQEYVIQISEPDGTYPSIGDSGKHDLTVLKDIMADNAEYLYVVSDGKDGTAPKNGMVFEDGGYAIFRSSWEDAPDEATWMLFNASTFSSAHKHGDDLEVLLYHKGELFVEAGNRDYNYTEKQTAWIYSGYGHNVLLINDKPYPVKIGANGFQAIYAEALKTKIIDSLLEEGIYTVTGYECRFEDVEQTRTLEYDMVKNTVRVEDVMEADKTYDGTLLWHVAQGVTVKEADNGWKLYRDGNEVASVVVTGDTDIELETIVGEGEYPYCTWIFNGNKNPSYGSLLKINFEGTKGKNEITTTVYLK